AVRIACSSWRIAPQPPTRALFPSPTPFRSPQLQRQVETALSRILQYRAAGRRRLTLSARGTGTRTVRVGYVVSRRRPAARYCRRSGEHTSELQSPDHLVCRLLLYKKNRDSE